MRRRPIAAVLALSAAVSAAAAPAVPSPANAPTPAQAVAALVSHEPPKGWRVEEYANGGGADPVVAFVDGLDRIAVRVFGAPGSGYETPAAFLSGPAASALGKKPEKIGSVMAAGRRLALYRRGFSVDPGDPHAASAGAPRLGREIFCVLPASRGRFVVLSYARASPVPDLERRGEKAWMALLKTVRLVGRKA